MIFIRLQVLSSGSRIASTDSDLQSLLVDGLQMLGELTNIPTGTLIDMLSVILAGGALLSAGDVAELEQIQRELQRRANADDWMRGRPN